MKPESSSLSFLFFLQVIKQVQWQVAWGVFKILVWAFKNKIIFILLSSDHIHIQCIDAILNAMIIPQNQAFSRCYVKTACQSVSQSVIVLNTLWYSALSDWHGLPANFSTLIHTSGKALALALSTIVLVIRQKCLLNVFFFFLGQKYCVSVCATIESVEV